ncbi:MAG: cyaB 3 [Planctomycetaceae bacterium]|nr:cyaB 3 [Planctomycetaceae bacterium]
MDLIAVGPEPRQRWRIRLQLGERYVLGRDHDGILVVPWDAQISRKHVEVLLSDETVLIQALPQAINPLFHNGVQVQNCELKEGEHFVIGQTSFQIHNPRAASATPAASPVDEVTFSRQALQGVRFRDADKRIEVLSNLPEVIWGARTDSELLARLVNLLLAGIVQAEAAAIVRWDGAGVHILQWDRRRETAGELHPSGRLIREAIGVRRQSVLHTWEHAANSSTDYTIAANSDWAFCTPVLGNATEGWGMYLTGERPQAFGTAEKAVTASMHLEADVKFAELVAEIVSSVRRLRQLERQQSGLRQFFAPAVLAAVGENLDTGLLAPREADVTILFCDLRGFSKHSESSRHDLLGLLDRVSQAMGIMTRHILAHGGGIGDFLGDAAMGFWGWPVASTHGPLDACKAALSIRAEFESLNQQPHHPLANFQMGIGIAHGRAVAGKIGTAELVKVTVFGPVVNLASRLEGMTRQLRVPILLDETVAAEVRANMPHTEGRLRKLARVLPLGMETALLVSELVPPLHNFPDLDDAQLAIYEQAVDDFIAGRWEAAYKELHQLPASDKAQDFLALQIAQHNRQAPPNWDGTIKLPSK